MKSLKNFMLVALLVTGLPVFADNPIEKANDKMARGIWPVVDAALIIGVSTIVGHAIVNSFESTKNMEYKSEKILATCVALYSVLLASSLYEEWIAQQNKNQEQIA